VCRPEVNVQKGYASQTKKNQDRITLKRSHTPFRIAPKARRFYGPLCKNKEIKHPSTRRWGKERAE